MHKTNSWFWAGSIFLVVLIIGSLVWLTHGSSSSMQSSTTASSTVMATSTPAIDTSGTNATAAPVTVNTKNSTKSIAQIVAGLTNATEYASLLNSAGVSVGGKGPYTVFISTNAGYALLKPGTITNMTAAQKKRMLQYSIVSGRMLDVNVQDSGSVKALSGDLLNFNVGSTYLVQVNSSYALGAYKASNGIVYLINQPLLPPTSGNIMTP